MLVMGVLGYLMRKFHYEPAPFIFAFILGGMFEEKLRQSLLYSSGSFMVFLQRPISASFVIASLLLLVSPLRGLFLRRKSRVTTPEKEASSMPRRSDLWSGAFLLLLGLAYSWEAQKLGLGTPRTPAPGFFPFLLGSLLGLLSLIFLYTTFSRKRTEAPSPGLWKGLRWPKTLLILATITAYIFLVEPLGNLIATLLLMGFLFKGIEPQRWRVALLGAVLSSSETYILFKVFLQVQLPRGILSLG